MSRFLSAFLAALFIAGSAGAQGQLIQPIVAASQNYVGPGDIVSGATAFYSCSRAYNAAYAAALGSACDLRRASDNATCTAKFLANGSVDLTVGTPCNSNTQTVTAWVGASSALVTKAYDGSGNTRDASQGTAAAQPQLLLSGGSNNLPYVNFAFGPYLTGPSLASVSQPYFYSFVAIRTGHFTSHQQVIGTLTTGPTGAYTGFNNTINTAEIYTGTSLTGTVSDSAWHVVQVQFDATDTINVDGSSVASGNSGSAANVGTIYLGNSGFNDKQDGGTAEAFLYPALVSAGNQTALQANQKAYYGTP